MMTATRTQRPPARAASPSKPRASGRSHPTPRLLLADDHALLLEAFRRLLEPEFAVVGAITDGHQLVEAALELRPDVVVLDISMPGLNGLKAGSQVLQQLPNTRLVFLTMHDDPALAAEAFRIGGSGYVLKTAAPGELLQAIRAALGGGAYVSPGLAGSEGESHHRRVADVAPDDALSPREREVLRLLAQGQTMKEAAAALGITTRTVAFHKYRIMRTLSLRSSAELLYYAIKRRIG
jgi:DNA-binding NarL/FixJ family response regulator